MFARADSRLSLFLMTLLLLAGSSGCVTPRFAAFERNAGTGRAGSSPELMRLLDDAMSQPSRVRATAQTIVQRRQEAEAQAELLARLVAEQDRLTRTELRAAVELYLQLPKPELPQLFEILIGGRRVMVRRTAWQVATLHPSPAMGAAVSRELSRRALRPGATGLSPEAALAVRANQLKDAYPLLRTALMEEGSVAYAHAMIALNPEAAADDLLVFLSEVDGEELARGTLSKARLKTCLVALRYFATQTPSLHHPSIRRLFVLTTAGQPKLAETASSLLLILVERQPEHFAFLLAQMPEPLQRSFLARLARNDAGLHAKFSALVREVGAGTGV